MINVTSAFGRALNNDNRDYQEIIEITLRNGVTMTLTNQHIWGGTYKIDDAVSSDNDLQLGSAIVNRFDFTINNLYNDFSTYDFYGATVVAKIALQTDTSLEVIRKGTYIIADDPVYNGDLIKVTCYDNMYFFDVQYNPGLTVFPATADTIIRNACTDIGITLATLNFPNKDLVIASPPDDEATTYREVIAYVAQMCGCFARCNANGQLELKWFDRTELEAVMSNLLDGGVFDSANPYATGDTADGGSFNPWTTGDVFDFGGFSWSTSCHYIESLYSHDISVDDVVVTGVRILVKTDSNSSTDSIKTYTEGSSGYVVEIKDNPLITEDNVNTIIVRLRSQLVGLTFRRAKITHGSDPSIEAGDIAVLWDRKQNVYPILVTHTTFSVGSPQSTVSAAQTPVRNATARFDVDTKNYVELRKRIKNERTTRESAEAQLRQQIANANGMHVTQQTDQSTGATITYLHNKSDLAQSDVRIMFSSVGITVTPDGGTHWYGLQVDGQLIGSILTATGVNADWINAGTLTITDNQGNTTLSADTTTGAVRIKATEFSLTNGDTLQSVATSAVNTANAYTDASLSSYQSTVNDLIEGIQDQLDGVVDTYYYSYTPTIQNHPADDWIEAGTEANHEGDLFLDTSTGKSYRWVYDNNAWQWKEIPDTASSQALQEARNAYDLADHKRRIFVAQPTPPYDVGDLWVQGTTGDILRCATPRVTGASYAESDWVKASKYTDNSALDSFLSEYADDLQSILGQLDQKLDTYYQSNDPSVNWSASQKSDNVGDLWYDTSSTGKRYYQWNGLSWDEVKATPPAEVFDRIDGKATIFMSQPTTPYHVGDLWFVASTDSNIPTGGSVGDIMTCMTQKLTGQFSASDWQKKNKYTDDTALTTFTNSVYNPKINSIESTLDGKVDTYFYNYAPSTSNLPASAWKTSSIDVRDDHLDDIFYNTTTGYCYRYTKSGSTYSWQRVKDTDITSAMNAASQAQDTADHKRRVFTAQPTAPYDVGDLWTQGANGDIMVCTHANATTGTYVASDWSNANKSLSSWISETYDNDLENIRGQLDGIGQTWYQDDDPSETEDWDLEEASEHTGDLWYCSDTTGQYAQKYFRWNGTGWDELTASPPEEIVTAISVKAKIFVEQPVPPYKIGDLWVQGASGDILKCVNAKTASGAYARSDWANASKYTDDSYLLSWIEGDYSSTLDSIRGQMDLKAETFYQDEPPSVTEQWDEEVYSEHRGDLWYCTATNSAQYQHNQTYRWSGSAWVAQDVPTYVFNEINGKAQIFVSTPTVPYYRGDLWVQGSTGDIMRCMTSRTTGSYSSSDWNKASKYTDDTLLEAQYGVCHTPAATDTKIGEIANFRLYTGARITIQFDYGNSAANPKLNVNSTGALNIVAKRSALAPVYYWRDGDIVDFVYNGSQWEMIVQDQEEIFKRLTNNSQNEGVYLSGGRLYINASMIKTGTLSLGTNTMPGALEVFRGSGSTLSKYVRLSGYGFWMGADLPESGNGTAYNNKSKFRVDVNGNVYSKSLTCVFEEEYVEPEPGEDEEYGTMIGGTLTLNSEIFSIVNDNTTTEFVNTVWDVYNTDADSYASEADETPTPGSVYIEKPNHPYPVMISKTTRSRNGTGRWVTVSPWGIYFDNFWSSGSGSSRKTSGYSTQYSADGFRISDTPAGYYQGRRGGWCYCSNSEKKFYVLSGTDKSKLFVTENYGDRFLYCYETPTPFFGDIGDGIIGEDGLCYVFIDPVFSETITTNQYQVFLQKYGDGDCWIKERTTSYFVVQGTPNLEFAWEMKAKQGDSHQQRLDKEMGVAEMDHRNYADEAEIHIENISINYSQEAETHIAEIAEERNLPV